MAIDAKDTRFIVEFLSSAYPDLKETEIRRLQREIPPERYSQLVRAAAEWRSETNFRAAQSCKVLFNGIDFQIFHEVGKLSQYTSTELTKIAKRRQK